MRGSVNSIDISEGMLPDELHPDDMHPDDMHPQSGYHDTHPASEYYEVPESEYGRGSVEVDPQFVEDHGAARGTIEDLFSQRRESQTLTRESQESPGRKHLHEARNPKRGSTLDF